MARPILQPLDVGATFDQTFKLYTSNWRPLLTISAVVMLPLGIISALGSALMFPGLEASLTDPALGTAGPEEALGAVFGAMGPLFVIALMNWVGLWLIQGACTHLVSDVYLGRVPDWRLSLGTAVRRFGAYLAVMILMGLGLIGGFFLCFVGAVWFGIMWSVSIPALMAEELGPWQAMQRSWGLVRGHFWRVLGLNILALMVVGIVSLALATPLQALTLSGSSLTAIQVTSQISNAIAYALTLPFQALLAAVIYFDLRVRKEAFDLEALAMGLDEVKQVPPAPPIPPQPDFGDSTPPMDDDRPPPPTDWDDPGSDPFS